MKTVQEYYHSHARFYKDHLEWPMLSTDSKNYWNIQFYKYLAKRKQLEEQEKYLDNLAAECTNPND